MREPALHGRKPSTPSRLSGKYPANCCRRCGCTPVLRARSAASCARQVPDTQLNLGQQVYHQIFGEGVSKLRGSRCQCGSRSTLIPMAAVVGVAVCESAADVGTDITRNGAGHGGSLTFERRFTPLLFWHWWRHRPGIGPVGDGRAGESQAVAAGPDVAQGQYHWKLVTTWPKNFPGLGSGRKNPARYVDELQRRAPQDPWHTVPGRLCRLSRFFMRCRRGGRCGPRCRVLLEGQVPSVSLLHHDTLGMNAQETNAWLHYGGGLELWRKPMRRLILFPSPAAVPVYRWPAGFNREIKSIADLQGLKMRIPGLAGDVFAEAGGTSVRIPGGEILHLPANRGD